MAFITKAKFPTLPATNSSTPRVGELKVGSDEASENSILATADAIINTVSEGFSFKVGDAFTVVGVALQNMNISKLNPSASRIDRLTAAGATVDAAPIVYVAINLTRDGKSQEQVITLDRLCNSAPVSTRGYMGENEAKVQELIDLQESNYKLNGSVSDRYKAMKAHTKGFTVAGVGRYDREVTGMDPIKPWIYVYAEA